jgi:L-ascorbate metabolism protein UlaG (beta-lactamase superfamily)
LFIACSGHDSETTAAASSELSGTDDAAVDLSDQDACSSLTPASAGGPMPQGDTLVVRWLGTSNYEVAYHGKVILMDTFYERPGRTRPIGITVPQIQHADAILIGHAHYDHISDVAPVAAQTHAQVYGAAISTAEAVTLGVPKSQVTTVTGNNTEHFTYGDIDIQPTHIIHSSIEPTLIPALSALYATDGLGPLTAAEQAQYNVVVKRGSSNPGITQQGTMGFTLTLASGFRLTWFDSVSVISPEEQQLADTIGHPDIALLPWTPHPIAENQLSWTFQHVQLLHPKLLMPTHHDHIWGAWLDNGLEPLFMKVRDELTDVDYVAPLYRSPVCVRTSGPDRGETYVSN